MTRDDGSFELSLPRERFQSGRYYYARILDSSENAVFGGSVILADGMTILVDRHSLLHGNVKCSQEPRFPWQMAIAIASPAVNALDPVFHKSNVDVEGRFSLMARIPKEATLAHVRFASRNLTATIDIALSELLSEAGARVAVDITEVEIAAFDAERTGAGIGGAEVRLWRAATKDVLLLDSPSDGLCRFRVQPGTWHWSVTKAGYLLQTGLIEVLSSPPTRVECRLARISTGRVLEGDIISGVTRAAVGGASVFALPGSAAKQEELFDRGGYTPFFDTTRTDADGHFKLHVPSGVPIGLLASHEDHALTPGVIVNPGVSRLRLVMEAAGRVTIAFRSLAPVPSVSGRTRCLLVDRHRLRTIPREGFSPIEYRNVPDGSYNVYALCADGSYGQSSVDVKGGQESEILIDTVCATWFEGQLIEQNGFGVKGASVRLCQEGWPDEVATWCATNVSDERGFFRIFGGIALRGILEASRRQGIVSQYQMETGSFARYVCR